MRFPTIGLVVLLTSSLCLVEEIATIPPGAPWGAGKGMELRSEPVGGPPLGHAQGGPWLQVKYAPQGYANLQRANPLSLEPGSVLKVWGEGMALRLVGGWSA